MKSKVGVTRPLPHCDTVNTIYTNKNQLEQVMVLFSVSRIY